MKKILSTALIVMLLCVSLSFVGCNTKNDGSTTLKKTVEAPTPTPIPTPYRNSNIVSYMASNADKVYYAICSDYDKPYYGSYEINGDDLLVTIKTERWGKYTENWASMLQKVNGADENLEISYNEYYAHLQKEMPGIEEFEVRVYDLNGNFFFSLPEPLWEVW